jgi:RNA polymerase sigma factor for flagellar operon FliA
MSTLEPTLGSEKTGPDHDLFLSGLPMIDQVVGAVTSRGSWNRADTEDFRSWTYHKLLEGECRVMRRFSGRSSLRTYLHRVVSNLSHDFRSQHLGRWRPSVVSRRLGRWATALDRLINRARVSPDAAVRMLVARDDCDLTERELRDLVRTVPRRMATQHVGSEHLFGVAGPHASDTRLLTSEHVALRRALIGKLRVALNELCPQDRAIVHLRFWEGLTVAQIATRLGLPQKPLYRRLEGCLARLRTVLERDGVRMEHVRSLLSDTCGA